MESDLIQMRSKQLKTFGAFFIGLTIFDLLLIIFTSIAASDSSSPISTCFQGCAIPVSEAGAAYMSIKFMYDTLTPQVYLIVFWYLPTRLLVSDVIRNRSVLEVDMN